jgi:hypothetical protein
MFGLAFCDDIKFESCIFEPLLDSSRIWNSGNGGVLQDLLVAERRGKALYAIIFMRLVMMLALINHLRLDRFY